jgi:hypothetical protein
MANTDFALTADIAEFDDLPRTLRREREAREKEKREREARESRVAKGPAPTSTAARPDNRSASLEASPSLHVPRDTDLTRPEPDGDPDYPATTVKRIDVPFFHMMRFYLKAVVAAIPALILLTGIMWGMGQLIKMFFPWLLKAQIFIQFPN